MSTAAGYSGTPLPKKLGVKDGHVVLLDRLPDGLDLGLPPTATVVRRLRGGLDLTVTFHTKLATLEDRLPALFEHTVTAGMVWVAWPKQAAVKRLGIDTDLNDNVVRRARARARVGRREGRRHRRDVVGSEVRAAVGGSLRRLGPLVS